MKAPLPLPNRIVGALAWMALLASGSARAALGGPPPLAIEPVDQVRIDSIAFRVTECGAPFSMTGAWHPPREEAAPPYELADLGFGSRPEETTGIPGVGEVPGRVAAIEHPVLFQMVKRGTMKPESLPDRLRKSVGLDPEQVSYLLISHQIDLRRLVDDADELVKLNTVLLQQPDPRLASSAGRVAQAMIPRAALRMVSAQRVLPPAQPGGPLRVEPYPLPVSGRFEAAVKQLLDPLRARYKYLAEWGRFGGDGEFGPQQKLLPPLMARRMLIDAYAQGALPAEALVLGNPARGDPSRPYATARVYESAYGLPRLGILDPETGEALHAQSLDRVIDLFNPSSAIADLARVRAATGLGEAETLLLLEDLFHATHQELTDREDPSRSVRIIYSRPETAALIAETLLARYQVPAERWARAVPELAQYLGLQRAIVYDSTGRLPAPLRPGETYPDPIRPWGVNYPGIQLRNLPEGLADLPRERGLAELQRWILEAGAAFSWNLLKPRELGGLGMPREQFDRLWPYTPIALPIERGSPLRPLVAALPGARLRHADEDHEYFEISPQEWGAWGQPRGRFFSGIHDYWLRVRTGLAR